VLLPWMWRLLGQLQQGQQQQQQGGVVRVAAGGLPSGLV
jgi:hypothetical protein